MHDRRFVGAGYHRIDVFGFWEALAGWQKQHLRPFPWRLTENPYHILVAEVMLHRTQAVQVVPVFKRFIEHYPDVRTLARAGREELRRILFPLGLRWRNEMMKRMAEELMNRFRGTIPRDKDELISLPGVSEYIASAVRCFAWNLPEPLIDTNTVRITGRLYGLEIKDSSRRNRQYKELISNLVNPNKPKEYNYALLDLAEGICMKKRQPDCQVCPVSNFCVCFEAKREGFAFSEITARGN